jgi:hypothetical protein
MEKRIYPKEVVLAYIQMYITSDYEERTTETGEWINISSIFDNESQGKKLGFNITKGYVHDFHGKYYPSFTDFVKDHQSISEKEALETIVRIRRKLLRKGISITPPAPMPSSEEARELPEISADNFPPVEQFEEDTIRKDKLGRKALIYLLKRGIKKKHIEKYNLQYVKENKCWVCKGHRFIEGEKCPNCKATGFNFYYGRIIIPTYENGKLVYFQGRDFLNRNKKYKYMNPSAPRSQVVYFYDHISEGDVVYVTEGPIDAMMLYDYSATSIMGNKITLPQVKKLLWKRPKEIIFIPDNDPNPETKKLIIKNVAANAKSVLDHADYDIKVGVYNWFKFSNEKDLNSANIDYIDEDYVFYFNNIKDQVRMRLQA